MSDVPRETPATPAWAQDVLGDAVPRVEPYVALLATEASLRGLIGPREVPRLWERHVLNSALPLSLVPEGSEVADVGTGAGLPGLVWALVRPDLRVVLVEPLLRRTRFLDLAVEQLGLTDRVQVWRGRAEDAARDPAHGAAYDVVTSRAVAPLPRLLGWSAPLARTGGRVLALKGRSADDEIAELGGVWSAYASAPPVSHEHEGPAGTEGATTVELVVDRPRALRAGGRRTGHQGRSRR